ncbi:MAG: HAMP domain-containing sensor histidine kinase [Pseudomonadota bacterium]
MSNGIVGSIRKSGRNRHSCCRHHEPDSVTPEDLSTRNFDTPVDRNHHRVIFEREDTGPGISDAIRQDIFNPFFTTKSAGKGTGPGLYICYDIVERHGGTLTLEKSHGKGARFVVKLPFES